MFRIHLAAFILALGLVSRVASAEDLKVSRVALFNSGVGYFECAGSVEGNSSSELKFRTGQINDILKSLVLRDFDGGSIAAVQYASRDPVEKALKSFGVDITNRPTLGQLLDSLRGVPVEVKTPNAVNGLIMGVEKRKMETDKGTIERDVLTILAEDGLRSFVLADISGVRITDAKIQGELSKALQTLAASHDAEKKSVTLNFSGNGKRRVAVSYLLETPIWKTSYRLVLADQKKPYLQGWAIVENATEQDWENVSLALVSGRPISFAMDLYQPLYITRPFEELELYRSLRPPTFDAGFVAKPAAAPPPAPMSAARRLESKQRGGLGGAGGVFEGGGREAYKDAEMEMSLDDSGVSSAASGGAAGELFQYSIKTPVSLERQHSAMLPIVTTDVEGSKLSIYNIATDAKHPLNGLKLKNTTGLHLTQGPITVFDGNIYAGDAKLPDLRPDEERLVAYALDLAVDVDVKSLPKPEETMQIWIRKGTLWQKRKYTDDRTYTLKNKASTPRTILIEQRVGEGWNLKIPEKAEEETSSLKRFKVEVPAGKTETLQVLLEMPREEAIILSNLGQEQIEMVMRARVISEPVKAALAKVITLRSAVDNTNRQINRVNTEIEEISTEQTRIRENMKTLAQSSEVYRRYEKKFDTQETEIEGKREQVAQLRKTLADQQQALTDFLANLSVD